MTYWKHWLVAGSAICALTACESPDTEAELDEFRAAALGSGEGDTGPVGCGAARPTPDGEYFCALSANLARDKPLFMTLTFAVSGSDLTVTSQPLVRDFGEDGETPMERARLPVGDELPVNNTTLGDDGSFFIDWPGITVLGDANPLTFRDLGGDLTLTGVFLTNDVAYGEMGGAVTSPAPVPLAGSTFACVKSDDPTTVDPLYYNEDVIVLTDCDLPGEGSGEGSGTGEGSGE